MAKICDRCKKETFVTTMSMFNIQNCCPNCTEKERAHPKFKEARDVELEQLQAGNYNYEGIGLPDDLKEETL